MRRLIGALLPLLLLAAGALWTSGSWVPPGGSALLAVTETPVATATVLPTGTATRLPTPTAAPTPTVGTPPVVPSGVGRLSVVDLTMTSITLGWVNPGPGTQLPAAAGMDLRYSTSLITLENWPAAKSASQGLKPAPAGGVQTLVVKGLAPKSVYYLAMRYLDAEGRWGPLSNVVRETTSGSLTFRIGKPAGALFGGPFQGFGAEWDPFYWMANESTGGANEAGWKKITGNIADLGVPLVRMMFLLSWVQKTPDHKDWAWDDPQVRSLLRYLDYAQANQIDVMLTDWGWAFKPNDRGKLYDNPSDIRYAQSVAAFVKELIETRKYTSIKYLVLGNEPDLEIVKWSSAADYVTMYRNVDRALRENGIRGKIKLTGPDMLDQGTLMESVVDQLKDVLDAYDFHRYSSPSEVSNEGLTQPGQTGWSAFNRWREAINLRDPDAARKPLLMSELGMDGFGSGSGHPLIDTVGYALHMADAGTTLLTTRTNGGIAWFMHDEHYFGGNGTMTWGMWKYQDAEWAVRPWGQAYGLLVKHAPRGSVQAPVNSTPPGVPDLSPYRVAAVKRPDGGWSIFMVNRSASAVSLSLDFAEPPEKTLLKYEFNGDTTKSQPNVLVLAPLATVPASTTIEIKLAPSSFTVLVEDTGIKPTPTAR